MFRPLSIFIGTRYTRAKRRNRFVSFISMTSMIGLSLGAWVVEQYGWRTAFIVIGLPALLFSSNRAR